MAPRITVSECPNCGAPVDPTKVEDPNSPACPFCRTILPTAPDRPPAPVFTYTDYSSVQAPIARSMRRAGRFWLIFTVVVVLVSVGLPIALPLLLKNSSGGGGSAGGGSPSSPNYTLYGLPVLPSAASAKVDAFVLAPDSGASGSTVLRRVDSKHDKVIWSSAAVPVPSGQPATVVPVGKTAVALVAGQTVIAYSADAGRKLWQSSISEPLATRPSDEAVPGQTSDCLDGCAVAIGGALVTLEKDGTLQAFSVAKGTQLWSRHLSDTPNLLQAAGGWATVVSSPKAGSDDLLLFNAANGTERTVSPQCPADGQGDRATPSEDTGFFISPNGGSLTVLVTGTGGCVVSYALPSGHPLWQSEPDANNAAIPFTLTGESVAAGDGYLTWTNDQNGDRYIWAVNLATHKTITQLIDTGKENQTVSLDGAVNGTLVAEIAPSYASEQPGIYGISLKSGRQLWMLPSLVTNSTNDGTQAVVVTSRGIAAMVCESSGDGTNGLCKFQGVSPASGDVTGTFNITQLDPAPQLDVVAGPGGDVLANIDSGMAVVFDPVSGNEDGQWPVFS